jgi:hypothetical protein
MNWDSLIGPAVVAAAVSAVVSITGMIVSASTARQLHAEKLNFDRELATQKFEFDKDLAQRKFDQDRAQLIHKRQFDLAEALLADAYRFRDLMAYVRNGFTFSSEGQTRKPRAGETPDEKRGRDSYFVPIERLQKEGEFISGFMAKQHAALAHFGPDATYAFQRFQESLNRVHVASGMLIDMYGDLEDSCDVTIRMRAEIWADYAKFKFKDDEVGKKIEEGVLLVEKLCKPVLEWKGA